MIIYTEEIEELYQHTKLSGLCQLLRIFLLFKGVKSLYFLYSIVNFTALNLQGITSLHLLTSRVGLLLLKLVRLFLQTTRVECTSLDLAILSLRLALTTLLGCVTRFSALQVLYLKTTLLGLSCCQRRLRWLLRLGRFIAYTFDTFKTWSRKNYLSRIGSSVIPRKRTQSK